MVGDLMAPVIAWQAFRVIEHRQRSAAPHGDKR
jgi:hypothetical protein